MAERYKTPGGHNRRKTPKMILFEQYFHDPKSGTYCNARGSAIKAGYSERYANQITVDNPYWLDADTRRKKMLEQAEKNLEWLANQDPETLKGNPQLQKIWQDTNKFIAERLGKANYSTRTEHTGKDGRVLFSEDKRTEIDQALSYVLNDDQPADNS